MVLEIIENPWLNRFYNYVKDTQEELFVVTPFFSETIIREIVNHSSPLVRLRFLFGASERAIVQGVSDYEALIFLHEQSFQRDIIVRNIPNLHAKIVIFDKVKAILSSSNLTYEGLRKNIEFGIELQGEIAGKLYKLVRAYWDSARELQIESGVNGTRKRLQRYRNRESSNRKRTPKVPLDLGKPISPKGNDLAATHPLRTLKTQVYHPGRNVSNPRGGSNLLFNIWWNDNGFEGSCLDISNKEVCRNYFIRKYGRDDTIGCERNRNGCDSAYIFANYAYYLNARLDRVELNKCAFFIARSPSDNKYWIVGYLFIVDKGADGFGYQTEGGEDRILPQYIAGDRNRSLRFRPYLLFDEALIKELSLGEKWGRRESSEVDWITRHTRSRASCVYISNSDAATILQTYSNHTTDKKHKVVISQVLNTYFADELASTSRSISPD